jgi:hypothetical protein
MQVTTVVWLLCTSSRNSVFIKFLAYEEFCICDQVGKNFVSSCCIIKLNNLNIANC